jgi:hypothetical protein
MSDVIEPLVAERDPGVPATLNEVLDSWTGLQGSVTVSPEDFRVVITIGFNRFDPITESDVLRNLAWYGTFDKVLEIYVSRRIPVGYFYHGPNVPDLLPIQVPEGAERVVRRQIPFHILTQVRLGLKPFRRTLTP